MLPIPVLQLNLGIYLKDNTTDLSVLVDRAVGGSSISDGELELMLHRYMAWI
jgi:alpha-mannosidase